MHGIRDREHGRAVTWISKFVGVPQTPAIVPTEALYLVKSSRLPPKPLSQDDVHVKNAVSQTLRFLSNQKYSSHNFHSKSAYATSDEFCFRARHRRILDVMVFVATLPS
jgi:hypothetical protein